MEIIEGTWEEIASRAEEWKGRRFKLVPVTEETEQETPPQPRQPEPNWEGLRALEEIVKSQEGMRMTSSKDTLKIIREGRAGAMWGYEPLEE